MNERSKLLQTTREKLRKFNELRGKEVQFGEFWDLVVVTAVDDQQKDVYELQIREKVERKELPLGINYHVFSDPPGSKIGNGGSTMLSLERLDDIYGKKLSAFRVILIHAGGFSQRLPSASALGKIFTALPLGVPLYQMLELKLAMYVDFPLHMKPGVLVTCADDIELYSIEDKRIQFDKPGFTALAHPSPLSIGTTHGVFVLEEQQRSQNADLEYGSCLHFLHKPSIKQMYDSGAVCKRNAHRLLSEEEFVYTDSTYYIDHASAMALLDLLREVGPLECEIDAYGDFLQALGPKATVAYTNNTANVAKQESSLVKIRQKIYHRLRGTPLNVILLNNSKFYHVGTTTEYLYHLTQDPLLRSELGLSSSAFSVCPSQSHTESLTVCCVMHSVLDATCSVSAGSVVEYSRLEAGVTVGRGSILSGCWVGIGQSVPDGVFVHSLCVKHQSKSSFVTVAFGIDDDVKKSVTAPAYLEKLKLFGVSLAECWDVDHEVLGFSGDTSSCSLWNACLFPMCPDLQGSFHASLEVVQAVKSGKAVCLPKDTRRLSMQEALQLKNVDEMLMFRKELYKEIMQKA